MIKLGGRRLRGKTVRRFRERSVADVVRGFNRYARHGVVIADTTDFRAYASGRIHTGEMTDREYDRRHLPVRAEKVPMRHVGRIAEARGCRC